MEKEKKLQPTKKNVKNNPTITSQNNKDYKQFIDCLKRYSDTSEEIKKKKEYQNYEKKMFKFLEKSITKKNMPKKDELYQYIRNMFQTMLYTRWSVVIRKGGSSLFYNLLCDVCNIDAKKGNCPTIESELKTEEILQNIHRRSNIYNNTKRKLIGGALTGFISLGAMPFGGFFASALSNLPAAIIMEMIEEKGETDVGFTSMSKTLWTRLGSLPGEYESIYKSGSRKPKKMSKNKSNQNIKTNDKLEIQKNGSELINTRFSS